MKGKYIILFIGILLSSCNQWLDIKPDTEMTKEEVFETQSGFKDALTGVYIRLKSSVLYGEQLTWGSIERLAQHWDKQGSDDPYVDYRYADASMEQDMGNLFSGLYKAIADINNILQEIDNKQDIFEPGYYELIKGEALALRAYCHFDILRLFGPIPTNISTGEILPYVTSISLANHPRQSYQSYTQMLEKDLNTAESLLQKYDPFCHYSMREVNKPESIDSENIMSSDTFWAYRQVRMNYWAVQGLKARFYLWIGGRESQAYECAKRVILAQDKNGERIFRLGDDKDMKNLDYLLSCEHIWALHVYNLPEIANDNFQGYGYCNANKNTITSKVFTKGAKDIRFDQLWIELTIAGSNRKFTTKKYWQLETLPVCQIPLLRLSEMYFIVMETSQSITEASEYYQEFCKTRTGITVSINTKEELENILMQEYRKEFYAEGQMFYMYKRKNSENILNSKIQGSEAVYVIPLPIEEGR